MTIEEIESQLKIGQCSPQTLVTFSDWLAAHSSSLIDRHEGLVQESITFFNLHREEFKSDKACEKAYSATTGGIELRIIESTQKRMKMLSQAIGRHLRISELEARNLF